mmetsp:Transcript_21536/g.69524  ORF Transcript_21536/g.69524 Transcript_21536/m.69524 type:complete len:231 (-) Transcript_21536:894-1586(-)
MPDAMRLPTARTCGGGPKTLAPSAKSHWLAMATSWSSVSKGMMVMTGPKTSSRSSRMDDCAAMSGISTTVGAKNCPRKPAGRCPPARMRAPAASAWDSMASSRSTSPGMHMAPMSTPVLPSPLSGGPCRIALAAAVTLGTNWARSEVCTKYLSHPRQFWPAAPKPARRAVWRAAATSARGRSTIGSLPPSSSVTGVSVCAARAMTRLPTAAEPTKMTWSVKSTTASPVSA